MVDTTQQFGRRLEQRFTVRDDCTIAGAGGITVRVTGIIDGMSCSADGQLIDLSRNGAKLFVPLKFAIGDSVGLRIEIHDSSIDVVTTAVVRWVGYKGQGNSYIGCALDTEFSLADVERFMESGFFERRRETRRKIDLNARMRYAEKGGRDVNVRLEDYSSGGFRFRTSEPIEQGESIVLTLDRDATVTVTADVVWSKRIRHEFAIGCKFQSNTGSDVFRAIVPRLLSADEPTLKPIETFVLRLSRWGWIGLAATILWFGLRLLK